MFLVHKIMLNHFVIFAWIYTCLEKVLLLISSTSKDLQMYAKQVFFHFDSIAALFFLHSFNQKSQNVTLACKHCTKFCKQ